MKLKFQSTKELKTYEATDVKAYDGNIVDVAPHRGMQLMKTWPKNFTKVLKASTFLISPIPTLKKPRPSGKLKFTYFHNFNEGSSFSIVAKNQIEQLRSLGCEVEEKPLNAINEKFTGFRNHFAIMHLLSAIFTQFKAEAVLKNLTEHFRYLVGFDVADTNAINQKYLPCFNDARINAIMLPTEFCLNALQQSGVINRLYLVPHGISSNFRPGDDSHKNLNVLTVFTSDPVRKGLDILIKIAKNLPQLNFIVKGNPRDFKPSSNVKLITKRLPEKELVKLYQSCDVYLNPYRGGGFELCPLEAMACGLPVVSTGWGCILDYCNLHNAYLSNVVGEFQLFKDDHYQTGSIAEPDPEHLAQLLEFVTKNIKQCKEKALRTSKLVREKYSWESSAKLFIKACKEIIEED